MMNNQAPYCLMSARFNQKIDKIELIECNTRATEEFQIKADIDFDNFISQIFIRKKTRPNYMISNQQIDDQCKYSNSLKGQIRTMIQNEIDKQRQDKIEMKRFQKQMTLSSKKRQKEEQRKRDKDLNNSIDEIKVPEQVDSNNFGMNQDHERKQDSSVKKLKLFQYDKEMNLENKLTAKLSLFKWHQYYVIITIEKKKQYSQSHEQKHKAITQYSYYKEKSNSISVNFNNQNNQINQQQQKQQQQNQKANYQPISLLLPPTTQMGSLNNISTSNNLQNISITPILANQVNINNNYNANISMNIQNNFPTTKYILQSDQTQNYNQYPIQTASTAQNVQNIQGSANNNPIQMPSLDLLRKEWLIELFQETLKITLQKLEKFKQKFNSKKLIQLNIDPQSYFRSFVQEIQLQNANLLKLIKLKSQKQQIFIQKLQLSDLSEALKEHFEPLFRENQMSLFIDKNSDECIATDQWILQQILVNLITYCYNLQKDSPPLNSKKQMPYIALKYTKNPNNQTIKIQIQMPFVQNHKFDEISIGDISLDAMKFDKITHKSLFLEIKTSQQLLQLLNKQRFVQLSTDFAKVAQFQSQQNQACSTQEQSDSPLKAIQNEIKNTIRTSDYTFQQNNLVLSLQNQITSSTNNYIKQNNLSNHLLSPIISNQNSFSINPSFSTIGNQFVTSPKKLNLSEKKGINESGYDTDFNNGYTSINSLVKQNQSSINETRKNSFDNRNQYNYGQNHSSPSTQPFQRYRSKKKSTYLKFKESQSEQNTLQNKNSLEIEDTGTEKNNEGFISKASRNNQFIDNEKKFLNNHNLQDENSTLDEKQQVNYFPIQTLPKIPNKQYKLSGGQIKGEQQKQNSKDTDFEYFKTPFQFSENSIANNSASFKINKQGQNIKNVEQKVNSDHQIPQVADKDKLNQQKSQNSPENLNSEDLEQIKVKVKEKYIFLTFSILDHSKSNTPSPPKILQRFHPLQLENSEVIKQSDIQNFLKQKDNHQQNLQNINNIDDISSNYSVDNLFNQMNDSNDSIKRWVDQQQFISKNNHFFEEI